MRLKARIDFDGAVGSCYGRKFANKEERIEFYLSCIRSIQVNNMKDYKNWHNLKTDIENSGGEQKFRDGEIWWCSLGENIGYEEDGKHDSFERPVLVLRKFNKFIFLGLPLTSQKHEDIFHSNFSLKIFNELGELIEEKESFAILSQSRLLSSKRMIRRVVKINDGTFNKIKQDFLNLVDINRNGPLSGSSGA